MYENWLVQALVLMQNFPAVVTKVVSGLDSSWAQDESPGCLSSFTFERVKSLFVLEINLKDLFVFI